MTKEQEFKLVEDIQKEHGMTLISVRSCAKLLNTSETTVKRLIYQHEIEAIKIGGNWKVPYANVITYCRARSSENLLR